MSTGTEDPANKVPDLPVRRVTINQLVGYNLGAYRNAAGLTQEELGKRLGGWTKVAVSAAERSWDGKRVRKFDADEIIAIATALGVPPVALLLPPPNAGTAVKYIFAVGPGQVPTMDIAGFLAHLFPGGYDEDDSLPMRVFRERVMALGASGLLFARADEALRLVAEEILGKGRRYAEQITDEARARAESLERDAQERHRQAVLSLVPQREELERRIDDLRAFEREYRSRLLAYLEGQVRDLKAGAADDGRFPAVSAPGTAGD